MVNNRKILYILRLVFTCGLLFVVCALSITIENNTLMGIATISLEEYKNLKQKDSIDFDVEILFNGVPAATDNSSNIIYIPEKISDNTKITDIRGSLSTNNPNYQLYFVEDKSIANIYQTFVEGNNYKIIALGPERNYTEYHIFFTTLPILNIYGTFSGEFDDEGRQIFSGKISFFDPFSYETGEYRTLSTNASWHTRGNFSSNMPKKSLKISLEKNRVQKIMFLSVDSEKMMIGF